jgi:biotin transporter BioY
MSSKKSSIKFSKCIVICCIMLIVIYTIVQVYFSYNLGVELSPQLTGCVYAFFGTELAACALVRIFDREDKSSKNKKDSNEEDKTNSIG